MASKQLFKRFSKKGETAMSEKIENRVFTTSPLPPVLHGVKLSNVKTENNIHAISSVNKFTAE